MYSEKWLSKNVVSNCVAFKNIYEDNKKVFCTRGRLGDCLIMLFLHISVKADDTADL